MAEMITIHDIMARAGLNQTQFARRFGIPLRTVQDWCGGRRNPPDYVLGMMAEILDMEERIK